MRPKARSAPATAAAICSGFVTSSGSASARSEFPPARSATLATSRAVATPRWPRSSATSATARPIPLEQPVTSQTGGPPARVTPRRSAVEEPPGVGPGALLPLPPALLARHEACRLGELAAQARDGHDAALRPDLRAGPARRELGPAQRQDPLVHVARVDPVVHAGILDRHDEGEAPVGVRDRLRPVEARGAVPVAVRRAPRVGVRRAEIGRPA